MRLGAERQHRAGAQQAVHEFAAIELAIVLGQLADDALEIRRTDHFLLGGEIECHDDCLRKL